MKLVHGLIDTPFYLLLWTALVSGLLFFGFSRYFIGYVLLMSSFGYVASSFRDGLLTLNIQLHTIKDLQSENNRITQNTLDRLWSLGQKGK